MSEELKPCPFCGVSEAVALRKSMWPRVVCGNSKCNAEGATCGTIEKAITAWNTRAGEKA